MISPSAQTAAYLSHGSETRTTLNMNRMPIRHARGFHDRFAERGVRVHRLEDLFFRRFELARQDELGKEFGDALADHVDAEEFAVLLVEDELHESVRLAGG